MLNEWFHILQNSLSLSDYEAYPKPKNQHNFRLQMLNNLTPKKTKEEKKYIIANKLTVGIKEEDLLRLPIRLGFLKRLDPFLLLR